MEKASDAEVFQRQIEGIIDLLTRDILPLILRWFLIALLFIALAYMVIRSRASYGSVTIRLSLLGVALALLCAAFDFWAALGEAFDGPVNRYRLPIDLSMTALYLLASLLLARRYRQNYRDGSTTAIHPRV
jgi:hypothetical protein